MPDPLPRNVELGAVIASRTFAVRGGQGRTAELRFGTPVALDQDAYCPVQLVGIGTEKVFAIYGIDTFQALQLAVRHAASHLGSDADQLEWEGIPAGESLHLGSEIPPG